MSVPNAKHFITTALAALTWVACAAQRKVDNVR
jgi:hypothetical protein